MNRQSRNFLFLLAVLLALLVAPHVVGEGLRGLFSKMLVAALFATAFSVMSGRAGLLSFGHAAFFGLGAIVTMHAMLFAQDGRTGIPSPLLPLMGAIAGAVCAAVAGAISSRRVGSYFTLITLAFAELIHIIAIQWKGFFGGEAGLTSMRMPWGGLSFANATQVYYVSLFWVVLGVLACWLFARTGFGLIASGIKENEERVSFLGFDVYLSKIIVFVFSGFMSGLAGGILAFANESATYTLFSPQISLEVVFQVFIGGTALFLGPAVSAAVLTFLPYALSDYTRLWPLYQGMLFMLLMYFAPGGVSSLLVANRWSSCSTEQRKRVRRLVWLILLIGMAFVVAAETTRWLVEAPEAMGAFLSGLGMSDFGRLPLATYLLAVWMAFIGWLVAVLFLGRSRPRIPSSHYDANRVGVMA